MGYDYEPSLLRSGNNLYKDIPNIKLTKNYTSSLSVRRVYKMSRMDAFCLRYT